MIHAVIFAGADVHDFAFTNFFTIHGEHIRFDNIVNMAEVASLFAIADDSERMSLCSLVKEDSDRSHIGAGRSHARAVDIEISKRNSFYSVKERKESAIFFADIFLKAVGAHWSWTHVLGQGELFGVAISGRRGRVNYSFNTSEFGGPEDV